MALTQKQEQNLRAVQDGKAIPIVHVGTLRALGLITTGGREKPGYVRATLTEAGKAELDKA